MAKKDFVFEIDDKELDKQLQRALRENPKETVKAVKDCLLDLAGESASRAPVETGDLRGNCVAELNGAIVFENQAPNMANPPSSLSAFGSVGYSLPYALRQHEELSYSHSRTDGSPRAKVTRHSTDGGEVTTYVSAGSVNMVAGGEAKFLERPFEERKQRYINRVKEVVKRVFK